SRHSPWPRAVARQNRSAAPPLGSESWDRRRRPWTSNSLRSRDTGSALRERSSRPCRSLVVPRLGFLYRILVEAYQWVNRQASYALASLTPVWEKTVQREKGSRGADADSRVAGAQAQPRPHVKPEDKSQVQVIARAAAILRALEEEPTGLSLGQIA